MKYRIEIWRFQYLTASYENDNIDKVLIWYLKNWKNIYDNGRCAFNLYENNKKLDYDKCNELGFYD